MGGWKEKSASLTSSECFRMLSALSKAAKLAWNIKVQFYFSMQQSSEMREWVSFEADAIIKVLSGVVQANLPWFQQVNFIKAPSYCFNVF